MRIIDARSGREVKVGETVAYPDGEWYRLLAVRERFLSADALVNAHGPDGKLRQQWVALAVRFTHPEFFLQKVGFFPS